MFRSWITVPTADVHVKLLPGSGVVRIRFRDASAVEKTIEQLEKLKVLLSSKRGGARNVDRKGA